MAGEWIKMRTSLVTSPKVNGIARILERSADVGRMFSINRDMTLSQIVTRNVTRNVTVSLLLTVWAAANEHTSDGVFQNADLSDIDDIVGVPGFGAAMASVGWIIHDTENDCVILPNFNEYNTSGNLRSATAKTNAQRQKEFRDRKKQQESNVTNNVTNDVTGNRREEKRREDLKDKPPLSGGLDEIPPEGLAEDKSDEIAERHQAPPGAGEPSGKFPMWEGWNPSPDFQRRAALWNRILTGPVPGFAEHELASFTDYWASEGKVFTQTQWEQKFADSVLYERKRTNQLEQKSGGNHAGNNNDAGESAALRQVREARAEWEQQQGLDAVGNHGGNLFEPLGDQERNDARSNLDGSDWFHDGHPSG